MKLRKAFAGSELQINAQNHPDVGKTRKDVMVPVFNKIPQICRKRFRPLEGWCFILHETTKLSKKGNLLMIKEKGNPKNDAVLWKAGIVDLRNKR